MEQWPVGECTASDHGRSSSERLSASIAAGDPVFLRFLASMMLVALLAAAMLVCGWAMRGTAESTPLPLWLQAGCAALLFLWVVACVRRAWPSLSPEAAAAVRGVSGSWNRDRFQEASSARTADPGRADAELRQAQEASASCLFQIAERLVGAPVSEATLAKVLSVLATTLGVSAAGLRLSQRTGDALHCECLITLHGVPVALTEKGEAVESSTYVAVHRAGDGRSVRCLSVPLRRGEETMAVLAVEAPESFQFDDVRVRLTQTAAMLMALALSGVSQGQEERRGALLAERAAIARELHDSLAQSLAFLKIQVAQLQVALRDGPASSTATQLALQLRQGLSSAYRQVKELISAFRVRMGTRGLGQALEEAVEEFEHKGGIAITLDFRLLDCPLNVNEEFHVLQVVREALSNTVRHARANLVSVTLCHVPGGMVTATVEDDGRGFELDEDRPTHYGLTIMRERAASLGGHLSVTARTGGGTEVRLVFAPEATTPERVGRLMP